MADFVELENDLKNIKKHPVSALEELRSKEGFALTEKIDVLNPCTSNELKKYTCIATYANGDRFEGSAADKSKNEAKRKAALALMCNMNITIQDLNRKKKKLQISELPSSSAAASNTAIMETNKTSTGTKASVATVMDDQENLTDDSPGSKLADENSTSTVSSSSSSLQLQRVHQSYDLAGLACAAEQIGKSVLACLNELCTRNKTKAISAEAVVTTDAKEIRHQVTLSVLFNGTNYQETAVERKKQDAKQKAALQLLQAMKIRPEDILKSKSSKDRMQPEKKNLTESTATSPPAPVPCSTTIENPKSNEDSDAVDASDECGQKLEECQGDPISIDTSSVTVTNPDRDPAAVQSAVSPVPVPLTEFNCMRELKKRCRKEGVSPVYNKINEEGPEHCKLFHVECRVKTLLNELVTTGTGKKIIQAERKAAMLMFDKIKINLACEKEVFQDVLLIPSLNDGDGNQISTFKGSTSEECKEQDCSNLISHACHHFNNLSESSVSLLRAYNPEESSNEKAKQMLTDIGNNEQFEIKYLDGNLPNCNDEWQWNSYCYFTFPGGRSHYKDASPSAFIGQAKTAELAQCNAAAKAMQFLKEIFQTGPSRND